MVLFSAAWTWGIATPARADAAAILPVFLINSRREERESWFWFIGDMFLTLRDRCQFKKSWLRAISETPDWADSYQVVLRRPGETNDLANATPVPIRGALNYQGFRNGSGILGRFERVRSHLSK